MSSNGRTGLACHGNGKVEENEMCFGVKLNRVFHVYHLSG